MNYVVITWTNGGFNSDDFKTIKEARKFKEKVETEWCGCATIVRGQEVK